MVHQAQLKVMQDNLERQRYHGHVNATEFMLIGQRQGLVAEMQTLNEFSKNLNSANSSQEADLAAQITRRMVQLSSKIQKINRALRVY